MRLRSWLTGQKPPESDLEKADRMLGPDGDSACCGTSCPNAVRCMRVQPTHWLVGYVASGRHRPGTTGTGPATGTVLSVVDVKVPRLLRATVPAGATIADLTLRVSPADGASYEVRTRIGFSSQHKRSVVAVEGATVSRPNCATGNTRFVSSSCCA